MTVTNLGSTFTTAVGDKTVVATPTLADYIVIMYGVTGTPSTETVSDNNSDGIGVYTRIQKAQHNGAGNFGALWVRNNPIGSATSTTFTAGQAGSTGGGLQVFAVSDIPRVGVNAVRGSGSSGNVVAGTPAPVLQVGINVQSGATQAALATSVIIGAILNSTNPAGLTPPTGYTELPTPDIGYATPATGLETCFILSGETGSTITWGGASASQFAPFVAEIDTRRADPPRRDQFNEIPFIPRGRSI